MKFSVKPSRTIIGFLIVDLLVAACSADISLTLKKKQYLPPPIEEVQIKNDNYNIHQQYQHQHQHQQKAFKEFTNGNSRYQMFEVHNHYKPSLSNSNKEFLSSGEVLANKKINTEHINAPVDYSLDSYSLDTSYVATAAKSSASNQKIIEKQQEKSNVNKLKGLEYLPPLQQSSFQSQQHFGQSNFFKGPHYLPPHQYDNPQLQSQSQSFKSKFQISTQFKGFEYLPPQKNPQYNELSTPQQITPLNNLPPYQSSSFQQQPKGLDYLPPYKDSSRQSQGQLNLINNVSFKSSDYLTPPENHSKQQYQVQNLPPGYDFEKPSNAEEAIAKLHTLPEQSPENHEVTVQSQIQTTGHEQSSNINNIPVNLPPGYDFVKPENSEQAIKQLHSQESTNPIRKEISSISKPLEDLPPGYDFQKPVNAEEAIRQLHSIDSTAQKVSSDSVPIQTYLSPDFEKSKNFEQTTNQLHDQHNFYQTKQCDPQTQSCNQVSTQNQLHTQSHIQPNQQTTQHLLQPFRGTEFLPHVTTQSTTPIQTALQSQNQQSLQELKIADYLPPVNSKVHQHTHLDTLDYTTPTTATRTQTINPTFIYPLSNYMITVQPTERYGNTRRPFNTYGTPFNIPVTSSTINQIPPMYRELSSRPQHYAPSMFYPDNAINTQIYTTFTENQYQGSSALNQQARETLQTFMPKDVLQRVSTAHHNSATSPAAKSITTQTDTAKISTVKIVNQNFVTTLNVLESLDHNGIRIIRILGPSQEEPTGDHGKVNVVSDNNQQTVQAINLSNEYLPTRQKRNNDNSDRKKTTNSRPT